MKRILLTFLILQSTLAGAHQGNYGSHHSIIVDVDLLNIKEGNQSIGQIKITESPYGLVFTPYLNGLEPGIHGFHIYQNPSCEPNKKNNELIAGLSAGGHWDPNNTGQHGFPWSENSHLGDLPPIYVENDGRTTNAVLAPRQKKLDEIKNRSLMIHQHGDNHSDIPKKLGGGGPRVACGVIK